MTLSLFASVATWMLQRPVVLSSGDTERISFVLSTYLDPAHLTQNSEVGLQGIALDGEATGGGGAQTTSRTQPKEHIVQSGETLSGISALYDLRSDSLVVSNPILATNKHMIKPGQVLTIPMQDATDAEIEKVVAKAESEKATKAKTAAIAKAKSTATEKKALASALSTKGNGTTKATFRMPVSYKYVSQYYGGKHTGLDLVAPVGTPIYATADGCFIHVARSGWNGGYGNVSIQQVGSGMSALYAHQADIYVKQGECVTKGEMIGRVGLTGKTTGAHLHFELRVNGSAVNPLKYFK